MNELECVAEPRRAAVLLDPLRLRILGAARQPASAAQMARGLRLPRQKVNYHVRELARARFLRRAGQAKKRNMIERRWVATARSYMLAPAMMGDLATDPGRILDRFSAEHLIALTARVQSEVIEASRHAASEGKRLATLSVDSEIRFESAAERARFAAALQEAILAIVSRHTSPARASGGTPRGRLYRLTVACHPIPARENSTSASKNI